METSNPLLLKKESLLESIFNFFSRKPDNHVRISDKGRKLLNDKRLATKLAKAILDGRKALENGNPINVKEEDISVRLVTTIKESDN